MSSGSSDHGNVTTSHSQSILARLPKCEHHLHIEGTLSPSLLFELAAKNDVDLPDRPEFASQEALEEYYKHFTDLQSFLDAYYVGSSVLITADDFERLAWDYLTAAKRDGVWHAELSFDPQAHHRRGISIDVVIEGLSRATKRAEAELNMSTCLIFCLMRDLGLNLALKTLRLAEEHIRNGTIVGIGLDSTEVGIDFKSFKPLYDLALSYGLRITAHAGEEGPPQNVWDTVDVLGCRRVDHGVHAAEDPALLQHLADTRTLLTVCPISNVCLKVIEHVRDSPLPQFLAAGVPFSINSDDPAYFGASGILECYQAVQNAFNWGPEEWLWICRSSIEGSWMDDEKKDKMLAACNVVLAEWESARGRNNLGR
ncbi:adenosine deaminase [Punctularia strigosozonata HHB-11173 SS5]|uniref:adenosine deaminase n=1 Tax=Punctularia strigosozonata (strain HHB-11173) TaxID=741275 RepID=UPI0004417EF2|nr:adenosine deaminase [Punctularia strigosozonata HHB-11173 SS5]EIN13860.1 adenosine deaminase [Punctularia strigosozonata HHB-11173 SS5]